jgi:hypothetical protein
MHRLLILAAVLIGGAAGLVAASHEADAGPSPSAVAAVAAPAPVLEAGWRRNWRRYPPAVVMPDADVEVDVIVPNEAPPLIAIVPVRPASCGQYRYWDGDRCVDARYNNPYIGPR